MSRVIAGKYQCKEKLGNSGRVFRASVLGTKSLVVVKILEGCGSEHEHFQNFVEHNKEFQALAHLNGPHTIQLRSPEQDRDNLYLVMSYAPGETLRSLLRKGTMSPERVVRLSIQILKGLEEIHGEEIIHRDLKPENIIVDTNSSEGEHVRIVGFGLAFVAGLTQTVMEMPTGASCYLSPEQASPKGAVEQSDIYSLGVVMFEMLAGRQHFERASNTILASRSRDNLPWPNLLPTTIPKPLGKIVLKALEKDLLKRYQSAQEMRSALETWLNPPQNQHPSTQGPSAQEMRIAIALEKKLNPPKTFLKKIVGLLLFCGALLAFLANIDAVHNLWGKVKQSFFRSPSAQQVSDVQQPPLAHRSQQTSTQQASDIQQSPSTQQTFHIQQTATLRIDSSPQGAFVVQQGAKLGKTPYVYQGSRNEIVSFQLRLSGYSTESISYTLTQSEATTSLILQPILSTLSVQSKPSQATVWIAEAKVGRTPFEIKKAPKEQITSLYMTPIE